MLTVAHRKQNPSDGESGKKVKEGERAKLKLEEMDGMLRGAQKRDGNNKPPPAPPPPSGDVEHLTLSRNPESGKQMPMCCALKLLDYYVFLLG